MVTAANISLLTSSAQCLLLECQNVKALVQNGLELGMYRTIGLQSVVKVEIMMQTPQVE